MIWIILLIVLIGFIALWLIFNGWVAFIFLVVVGVIWGNYYKNREAEREFIKKMNKGKD